MKETNAPEPAHMQEDTTDTARRKRAAPVSEKGHEKPTTAKRLDYNFE